MRRLVTASCQAKVPCRNAAGQTAELLDWLACEFTEPSFAQLSTSPPVQPLHFAPRAKRVIYLSMAGGPSHLETLDFKRS